MTQPTRRSTRQHKSTKKDSEFFYPDLQRQMSDWHFPAEDDELFTKHSPYVEAASSVPKPKDPTSASKTPQQQQLDLPARDITQEINLVQLQKDKLALELEVLRLRHAPSSPHHDAEQSTSTTTNSRKKRTIDWPHEFAPGNALDNDKLDLPNFVTGFLSMIKPYETPKKNAMLDYLELLMLKASSYSWPSVRSFHSHIAKQIELCRLEWTSSQVWRSLLLKTL